MPLCVDVSPNSLDPLLATHLCRMQIHLQQSTLPGPRSSIKYFWKPNHFHWWVSNKFLNQINFKSMHVCNWTCRWVWRIPSSSLRSLLQTHLHQSNMGICQMLNVCIHAKIYICMVFKAKITSIHISWAKRWESQSSKKRSVSGANRCKP